MGDTECEFAQAQNGKPYSRASHLDTNMTKANAWCNTNFTFVGSTKEHNPLRGICMVHDAQTGHFRLRQQNYTMTGSYGDICRAGLEVIGILAIKIPHCLKKEDVTQLMADFKAEQRNRFFMHELARCAFGKFRTPFEIAECTLSFTTAQLVSKLRRDTLNRAERDVCAMYDVARCFDGLSSDCHVDDIPFWSKDAKQALIWYQRAAALGHRGAEESVLRLKEMAEGWYGVTQCLRWCEHNRIFNEE